MRSLFRNQKQKYIDVERDIDAQDYTLSGSLLTTDQYHLFTLGDDPYTGAFSCKWVKKNSTKTFIVYSQQYWNYY